MGKGLSVSVKEAQKEMEEIRWKIVEKQGHFSRDLIEKIIAMPNKYRMMMFLVDKVLPNHRSAPADAIMAIVELAGGLDPWKEFDLIAWISDLVYKKKFSLPHRHDNGRR